MIRLKRQEIEQHIKSAVDRLTPDVLDRIDLTTPQEIHAERLTDLRRRRARLWGTAAACFLAAAVGSGGYNLYRNSLVDSIVGLDVNPSVELSINRKERVLKADALNEDARTILQGMDLKGVELNVAVNAIVGSMVSNGYLEELDSTILVTVMGDSVSRTAVLRSQVVADVEKSLEENQAAAIVYDQQAVVRDDVREMADQYGISYGKAYFLDELVDQSPALDEEDLPRLSAMTMEEIAREVAEVTPGLRLPVTEETAPGGDGLGETAAAGESPSGEESSPDALEAESSAGAETDGTEESGSENSSSPVREEMFPTWQEDESESRIRLDYVVYEDGEICAYFKTQVRWRSPTVSVQDRDGEYYPAYILETGADFCRIRAEGLTEGETYYFTVGGLTRRDSERLRAVTGPFQVPEQEAEKEEETAEESAAETESSSRPEGTLPPDGGLPSEGVSSPESTSQSAQPSASNGTAPSGNGAGESSAPDRETESSAGAQRPAEETGQQETTALESERAEETQAGGTGKETSGGAAGSTRETAGSGDSEMTEASGGADPGDGAGSGRTETEKISETR